MKKILWLFILFAAPLFAQTAAITNYCNTGAVQITTSGLKSSNYAQVIIPYCTVTVYQTGTTTLASIYSDSSGTILTNSFKANADGSWLFFAAINQGYDVVLSGGTCPNCYTTSKTLTGLYPAQQFINPAGLYLPLSGGTLTGALNAPTINAIVNPCLESGTTADVQILAAYTALSSGGTIDARCYGSTTQTIATTLTLGDGIHAWTLLCDPQTTFIPGGATVTMIRQKAGLRINGCHFDTSSQASYTGTVLQLGSLSHVSDTGPVTIGSDTYDQKLQTFIDGVQINMGSNSSTTGHAIDMLASSQYDSWMSWVKLNNIQITAPNTCINMQTAGTGWVNSNQFENVTCIVEDAAGTGILAQPNGGSIAANQFTNYSFEGNDLQGVRGIYATGSGYFNRNQFSSTSIWDTPPFVLSNAGTSGYTTADNLPTTTSGSGTGMLVSITASGGIITSIAPSVGASWVPVGYHIGDKIYPTQSGSSADAYATIDSAAVDLSLSGSFQNNAIIGVLNGGIFLQNGSYAANALIDSGSQFLYVPIGWNSPITSTQAILGATVTANGGVTGQGMTCARNGAGGGVCYPLASITGTTFAIGFADSGGTTRMGVLGNGSAWFNGFYVDANNNLWNQSTAAELFPETTTSYHGANNGGPVLADALHGTDTTVQMSDGTGASGDCAEFSSNGSVTDAGAACNSSFSGSLSGDVTGTQSATTVGKLENIALPTLASATGILYDTSGVLSLTNTPAFSTVTANNGVAGQGVVCGRNGGTGGGYCESVYAVTGTSVAMSIESSGGNGGLDVLGNGAVSIKNGLVQKSTGILGGSCAMSTTSCTVSVTATFANTPLCLATVQSATVIAGGCTVSGSGSSWTLTITAASSNSSTWSAFVFGDPN